VRDKTHAIRITPDQHALELRGSLRKNQIDDGRSWDAILSLVTFGFIAQECTIVQLSGNHPRSRDGSTCIQGFIALAGKAARVKYCFSDKGAREDIMLTCK